MFNDTAKLCSVQITYDTVGNSIETYTKKEVFIQPRSIGMREFYQAAEVGMRPDYTIVLADYYDYNGEKIVEYDGAYYDVTRTYRRGTRLEIVLTERAARK